MTPTVPLPPDVFSVDVEEYFQVSAFEKAIPRTEWESIPSRLVGGVSRILELLAKQEVQATFFILGWIAERHPGLVARIAASGHEVACHGYDHRLIYHMTPDAFREDVRRAKAAIEDASGSAVMSYRAPSFSVTRKSLWALDVLAEMGFQNDASVFPIRHDRYGIPDADPWPHRIPTSSGSIREFPSSTVRLAGCNAPLGGGGYLRLFPWPLTRRLIRRVHTIHRRPCMVYVHPWELDPDQPCVSGVSWLAKVRHRVGLRSTERKLQRMLATFRFTRLDRCLDALPLPEAEWYGCGSGPHAPPGPPRAFEDQVKA